MQTTPPPLRRSLPRILFRLLVVVAIVFAVHLLMNWVLAKTATMAPETQSLMLNVLLVTMLCAYSLLIAVPFVPGVEIGLTLMLLRGAPIAPLVYAATVIGLAMAFLVGRYTSYTWLHRVLLDLRLTKVCGLLEKVHHLSPDERVTLLKNRVPGWFGPHLVRTRYLILALAINIPGNTMIGGGGGIALVAGLSRIFKTPATLITIALAVAPVPIVVWFFGIELLGG